MFICFIEFSALLLPVIMSEMEYIYFLGHILDLEVFLPLIICRLLVSGIRLPPRRVFMNYRSRSANFSCFFVVGVTLGADPFCV